jgi:hypothetical protein
MMRTKMWLIALLQGLLFSYHANAEIPKYEKGKPNFWSKLIINFLHLGGQRATDSFNHTITNMKRAHSDCYPDCPKVNVWKYEYQDKSGSTCSSDKPISTRKEHWKVAHEARVIALTLFGNQQKYLDGLLDFIHSITYMRTINKIEDPIWGYETFTLRVYVAKRHPDNQKRGELKNATDEKFIQQLLDLGCEIAYVDNDMEKVGRDATFWRFLIAGEDMPEGQTLRYLLRDVDWKLTAVEAFTVGEWINSGLRYHRMHLMPVCIGPLTASIWGGYHTGKSPMVDLHRKIEYFPYRLVYGDDELFLRDVVWPQIKASGSIMTHMFKRGAIHFLTNPYAESCEEPTKKYCDMFNPENKCVDMLVPKRFPFPYWGLAHDNSLKDIIEKDINYFLMPSFPKYMERVGDAITGMSVMPKRI